MSKYKIQKGVPIPDPNIPVTKTTKYPWKDMEVGDSFLVPNKDKDTVHALQNAARLSGKKHNRDYITRKLDKGIRCWRTR